MDFKVTAFIVLLFHLFIIGCNNCDDPYGQSMELEVSIDSSPSADTLRLGDTLWVSAEIDKNVEVRDANQTIYLEDFNFFTEMNLSEISTDVERYDLSFDIVEQIGEVEVLNLTTAITYPIIYEESANAYKLRFGIVFHEVGFYYLGFFSSSNLLESYSHPALLCNGEHRSNVDIQYSNSSSSEDNYRDLLLSTSIDYILNSSYEEFEIIGMHSFVVID